MIYELSSMLEVRPEGLCHTPIKNTAEFFEYLKEDIDDRIPYHVRYEYIDSEGDKDYYDEWIGEENIVGYAKKIFIGGE